MTSTADRADAARSIDFESPRLESLGYTKKAMRRAVNEGAELSLGQAIALESRLAERALLAR